MLDADVIIGGEKGTFNLSAWMSARPDDQFEIAAVTAAELRHGVERASQVHRAARERYIAALLDLLPVIPYTQSTAFEHAHLWASLESSGQVIGAYDLIVAATALERGSSVATFNTRHFGSIKGLNVIEPK